MRDAVWTADDGVAEDDEFADGAGRRVAMSEEDVITVRFAVVSDASERQRLRGGGLGAPVRGIP